MPIPGPPLSGKKASSQAASGKAKINSHAALVYSDLNLNNDLTTPINKTNERRKKGIASKASITLKDNGSALNISYDFERSSPSLF